LDGTLTGVVGAGLACRDQGDGQVVEPASNFAEELPHAAPCPMPVILRHASSASLRDIVVMLVMGFDFDFDLGFGFGFGLLCFGLSLLIYGECSCDCGCDVESER
jgi:hypothetical protein